MKAGRWVRRWVVGTAAWRVHHWAAETADCWAPGWAASSDCWMAACSARRLVASMAVYSVVRSVDLMVEGSVAMWAHPRAVWTAETSVVGWGAWMVDWWDTYSACWLAASTGSWWAYWWADAMAADDRQQSDRKRWYERQARLGAHARTSQGRVNMFYVPDS